MYIILWFSYCVYIFFRCETDGFKILIDDTDYYLYKYRNSPEAVSGLYVSGRVKLFKISYYHPSVSGFVLFKITIILVGNI